MNKEKNNAFDNNYIKPNSLTYLLFDEGLKSMQRSIPLLRQNLSEIIREKLFTFQNQKRGNVY